jgi:hypothetical protein
MCPFATSRASRAFSSVAKSCNRASSIDTSRASEFEGIAFDWRHHAHPPRPRFRNSSKNLQRLTISLLAMRPKCDVPTHFVRVIVALAAVLDEIRFG